MRLHHIHFWRRWVAALAVVAIVCVTAGQAGASDGGRDDRLRVAMLYNIARFVWWVDNGADMQPLEFCVSDAARIASSFHELQGKKVRSRTVEVRIIPVGASSVSGCSVVYFASDGHLSLADARPDPFTLTTGETKGFASKGGVIEFIRVGRQQRFSINIAASEAANLEISSRLIDLAVRVE
ncbi:MAG: YfiR family protein [Pseudomonadota bacterium]